MQFKKTVKLTMIAAASAVALTTMNACDSLYDDLDECPQGLTVEFVYDYNVERADMFNDHVGSVTLYVYDLAGRLVRTQTEENTATAKPLRDKNYRMTVEGLPVGEYRLLALANQRPYNQIASDPGIRYIRNEAQQREDLNVELQQVPYAAAPQQPVFQQQLDTLWHGTLRSVDYDATDTRAAIPAQTVSVREGVFTHCTMSLVRDTKRLHVAIHQTVNRADCDIRDYEVYITDVNGRILYDNTVDTISQPTITYRPFDEWNTYYDNVTGTSSYTVPEHEYEMTAHADLDFNRLMLRPAIGPILPDLGLIMGAQPAMLYLIHRTTGKEVLHINLAEYLAQGRGAFERYAYSGQEFLDRAYDYRLDFTLVGEEWKFISLHIHTLPWNMRWQNVDLE